MEVEIDPRKRGFGKAVLVVDDNAPIRKLLATAFLSDGFRTCGEAANGTEAIELAQQIKPDLITMDLSTPGISGLVAFQKPNAGLPSGGRALEFSRCHAPCG